MLALYSILHWLKISQWVEHKWNLNIHLHTHERDTRGELSSAVARIRRTAAGDKDRGREKERKSESRMDERSAQWLRGWLAAPRWDGGVLTVDRSSWRRTSPRRPRPLSLSLYPSFFFIYPAVRGTHTTSALISCPRSAPTSPLVYGILYG